MVGLMGGGGNYKAHIDSRTRSGRRRFDMYKQLMFALTHIKHPK